MSAAHTPGPWHVDTWLGSLAGAEGTDHDGNHHAVRAADLLICTTGLVDTPESAENARLIAAAPQLAEALRGLMSEMERGFLIMPDELAQEYRNDIRALVERADAALAAAGVEA